MNLGLQVWQKQELKLVMTPELRQSIMLLQYSAVDLAQFLKDQALENPLIDLEEAQVIQTVNPFEQDKTLYWEEAEKGSFSDYVPSKTDYVHPLDYYVPAGLTLVEYLEEQIGYLALNQRQKEILSFLIGNLNESGYLEGSLADLPPEMKVTEEEWQESVTLLHQLEPYGVGAKDLRECLLIQLAHMPWKDEVCEQVIRNHLDDLAASRYGKIAKEIGTSSEEIQQVATFIKSLQPKPGSLFRDTTDQYFVPDVFVEQLENGQFIVQVNDDILPSIHLNQGYQALLQNQEEAQSFLEKKVQELRWLVKSLEQRQQTLLLVTEAIVAEQIAFFQYGPAHLKPLNLKDIAEKINVHESTVSRATSNKYVQTPQGVFELKFFFSARLATADGEDASATQVKHLIKQIIDSEDKRKPLSDQKLAELLQERGINIARRTVAKYRDQLLILPASKRKNLG